MCTSLRVCVGVLLVYLHFWPCMCGGVFVYVRLCKHPLELPRLPPLTPSFAHLARYTWITHSRARIHIRIYTQITHMQTHTCHIHTQTQRHTQTHSHTQAHTYSHRDTQSHRHTHRHTDLHTHTLTHQQQSFHQRTTQHTASTLDSCGLAPPTGCK